MDKFAKILNQLAGVPKKDLDYMQADTGETIEEKNRVLSARDADLAQNPESSTPEESAAKDEYMSRLMDMAGFGMMGMAKAVKPPRNTMIYEPKGKIKDIKGDVQVEPKTKVVYPGNLGQVGRRGGYGTIKTAPQSEEVMEIATAGKNLVKTEPSVQNNLEKLKSNPVYPERLKDWRDGKINTEAFTSWKQEMLDKIKRGETF